MFLLCSNLLGMNSKLTTGVAKGRGAISNRDGRYLHTTREAVHDGWDIEEELPPLRTQLHVERPRKVITRNSSPDIRFDRAVTPYRGCEHGCIYCFARPSHAWLDMSPGLDFETQIVARKGAAAQLAKELSVKGYVPKPIAIGTVTDAYQPFEQNLKIMREILEVALEFRHPVAIVTKGSLIERDLDILGEMAKMGLVRVGVSITTLDRALARSLEPRVPPPARRLAVIEALAKAGVPVRVQVAPIIPGLTDHEIEEIVTAAAARGAYGAMHILLRLPLEVAEIFEEWIQAEYPHKAEKVLARLRDMHGGKIYDSAFGKRFTGGGPWADLIAARMDGIRARLGLNVPPAPMRTDLFRVPPRPGDQLTLL